MKRSLSRGMHGTDVAELQRRLGMVVGNGMGTFDVLTEAAVRSFQRKYKLSVDGIAGPQTLRKLEENPQ